jgi:hypothetical protein
MNGSIAGLNDLRKLGRMTWSEDEHGWVGVPEEILDALAKDGFDQCKREMTTSHRDCRPAGGVWQGVNPRTGSVASAIWVTRPAPRTATVFIQVDGESIRRAGRHPDEEAGGQG